MGIPDHLICLLRNMHAGQEAAVRTGHRKTHWFEIGKEVYTRLYIVTLLININAENIMQNDRLVEAHTGIKIAGRSINNLR